MVASFQLSLIITCLVTFWVHAKISPLKNHIALQSTFALLMDTTFCRTIPGLTKWQLELCHKKPDVTEAALQGLQLAVRECQHQFVGHRWNCSSLDTKARNPYTSAIFQKGYKEAAFAYAIASAGVVISIAKACSQGHLLNCGCDVQTYKSHALRPATSKWQWSGCSHNIHYGVRFAKKFLDSREEAGDIHSKLNLHNNRVGRMTVSRNTETKCKCHGMSGSCELKTCWKTAPDFRQIGKILKERFRSSVLVDLTNHKIAAKKRRYNSKLRQWMFRKNSKRTDFSTTLFYYEKSPTFCDRSSQLDVEGTLERQCNRTSFGPDSCASLCCGRGYNHIKRKRTERCNCKFLWCCSVNCDTCVIEEWITVCK